MTTEKTYYSNGKLLITGEYVVLDGAKALAIPTQFGQSLTVHKTSDGLLEWRSYDYTNKIWLYAILKLEDRFEIVKATNNDLAVRLVKILNSILELNPNFSALCKGKLVKTHLDFNEEWGLGTSSTLINNLANWAGVDAYNLLELTFGGSGYDIACAQHNDPIIYSLSSNKRAAIPIDFSPKFNKQLYFVYLNKKKNSRDAISNYKANQPISFSTINEINDLTEKFISCNTLVEFQYLMKSHEAIISSVINETPVQRKTFNDFKGQIKSLGGWGGDFILVASEENPSSYFKDKGFNTFIPYSKMILSNKN